MALRALLTEERQRREASEANADALQEQLEGLRADHVELRADHVELRRRYEMEVAVNASHSEEKSELQRDLLTLHAMHDELAAKSSGKAKPRPVAPAIAPLREHFPALEEALRPDRLDVHAAHLHEVDPWLEVVLARGLSRDARRCDAGGRLLQ